MNSLLPTPAGGLQRIAQSPILVRVLPFLLFVGLTLTQGRFGPHSVYWIYSAKTLLGAAMVWAMWPWVTEMRWAWSGEAVFGGIGVFVMWVALDPYYPHLDEVMGWLHQLAARVGLGSWITAPQQPHTAWNPVAAYGEGSVLAWVFALTRLLGSSLVVPFLEEVFYRSFLYRYLARPDFLALPATAFRLGPFVMTAAVFGLAHHEWLAGILCAVAYQAIVLRRGRLGDAITAHALTNFLLGLWVITRGDWKFW